VASTSALGRAEARELQRHLALECAIGALGEPHVGHATAAELADQSIGADHRTRREARRVAGADRAKIERRQSLQDIARFDARIAASSLRRTGARSG
jgi:hypothetical protein